MKHSTLVGKHLPRHFKNQYADFVLFIETYYKYMETPGFMNEVIRGRIQRGDSELVRDDPELFIQTQDERLSGIRQDLADIDVANWRPPEWWINNMVDIQNMERIRETLKTFEDQTFKTSDGTNFDAQFVHDSTVSSWMSDSGFPEATLFGGDHVLTARILRSLYQLKGTTKALELFFNVFYGEAVSIINPNNLIAVLDDNFVLDSSVVLKDDIVFSEFGIIIKAKHDKSYYEPLFTDVYLKMFHPSGFGVNFIEGQPDETPIVVRQLDIDLFKPYANGISNNGTIQVKQLQGGNSWEYTIDGGSVYRKGYGTTFQISDGHYLSGKVGARQITPAGEKSQTKFMGAFYVETKQPLVTVFADSEYKRIKGSTLPRIKVELFKYSGELLQTTKSDNSGIYRFVFLDGIPVGEYVITVTSTAGNQSTITFNANYQDKLYPVPNLKLVNDTGGSATDYISKDGLVEVSESQGYAWEYSTNGGSTWNDGSGTSFRLKHGKYRSATIMARTKKGIFHSQSGFINAPVNIILLNPKINVSRVEDKLIINSTDVQTVSVYNNGSYVGTYDLKNNNVELFIQPVDWDEYRIVGTDMAGNTTEVNYTVQIL
ncbi:hypothetical protein SHAb15599_00025 [Acinetobacter phage SH-Ab 15599]|nr:hypothetical protein SHAb15599_00025 [Acinetobacter phage SH-Ab 15599]